MQFQSVQIDFFFLKDNLYWSIMYESEIGFFWVLWNFLLLQVR